MKTQEIFDVALEPLQRLRRFIPKKKFRREWGQTINEPIVVAEKVRDEKGKEIVLEIPQGLRLVENPNRKLFISLEAWKQKQNEIANKRAIRKRQAEVRAQKAETKKLLKTKKQVAPKVTMAAAFKTAA